jgi:hypothetical protein
VDAATGKVKSLVDFGDSQVADADWDLIPFHLLVCQGRTMVTKRALNVLHGEDFASSVQVDWSRKMMVYTLLWPQDLLQALGQSYAHCKSLREIEVALWHFS